MTSEKEYQELLTKGYNNGYLLSRFEPELYKKVVDGCNPDQPYFKGMIEGHRAAEREVFLQNLQNARKLNSELRPRQ